MEEAWPLPAIESIKNSGSEWILQALDQVPEQMRMMMMMTWWRVWHVRNEVVHHKPVPPIEASRRFLCSYLDSLLCIKRNPMADPIKGKSVIAYTTKSKEKSLRDPTSSSQAALKTWTKPPPGWSKLNVDGAWTDEESVGGTGMILRDDVGMISVSACWSIPSCSSPLEAGLRACVNGLALALQWTDKPILMESDRLEAIKMINDTGPKRSHMAALVAVQVHSC
jgi:hypothetical protein